MLLRARAAVARRRQWLFVSASTKKHVSLLLLPSLLLPHLLLLLGRRSLQMVHAVASRDLHLRSHVSFQCETVLGTGASAKSSSTDNHNLICPPQRSPGSPHIVKSGRVTGAVALLEHGRRPRAHVPASRGIRVPREPRGPFIVCRCSERDAARLGETALKDRGRDKAPAALNDVTEGGFKSTRMAHIRSTASFGSPCPILSCIKDVHR